MASRLTAYRSFQNKDLHACIAMSLDFLDFSAVKHLSGWSWESLTALINRKSLPIQKCKPTGWVKMQTGLCTKQPVKCRKLPSFTHA